MQVSVNTNMAGGAKVSKHSSGNAQTSHNICSYVYNSKSPVWKHIFIPFHFFFALIKGYGV